MQRQQWWISIGDKPDGPHDRQWIVEGLESGQVTADQLACPVGGGEWKAVRAWPEFLNHAGPPPPPQGYSDSHAQSPPTESLFTNPRLPPLGNAICVYAILVSPVLWVVYHLSSFLPGGTTVSPNSAAFPMDLGLMLTAALSALALTVAILIGGLRLRSLRRSSITILTLALWGNLASNLLMLVLYIGFLATIDLLEIPTVDSPTGVIVFTLFLLFVALAEFVFRIIALVWLHLIGPTLPLTAD